MSTADGKWPPGPSQRSRADDSLRALRARFRPMLTLFGLVLVISLATRTALMIRSAGSLDWHPLNLLGVFAVGLGYDLLAASYLSIPLALYLIVAPAGLLDSRISRGWSHVCLLLGTYALLCVALAEWMFWGEFQVRFNFIAIDYLVYTTEVLENIRESYPIPAILTLLLIPTLAIAATWNRYFPRRPGANSRAPFVSRLAVGSALLLIPIVATAGISNRMCPGLGGRFNQELARNGIYSFVAAFRGNELDYERFYNKIDSLQAFGRLRELLNVEDARFVSDDPRDVRRWIRNDAPEAKYNVIQITVESLSAAFMGAFGNPRDLTPNLDRVASQGLLFTNFHATGTRTVRGMEALTLSLPPTPGRSIVKRPDNEHLFTLGSVFQNRGYDTVFLYGGYAYFDDMSPFFESNGYRVVDRATKPAESVTFTTAWGACDEDLFRWVIEEADRDYAAGTPFFHFAMTTSNHRPYTYPDGKIDIPSGSGRDGAVKYTDYAIGEFLRAAAERPWFEETLFVIVADHCANSSGRFELPIDRYEIPLILYNPHLIRPRKNDRLSSQIDYPPTLLALLGWSYQSRFFGRNILGMADADERAFVATYQKLGLMRDGRLAVLQPVRKSAEFLYDRESRGLSPATEDDSLVQDAIVYYQTASELFSDGLYSSLPARPTDSDSWASNDSDRPSGVARR